MTFFYIKNNGIYFKAEENSHERFLSSLSDQVYKEAWKAIEAWKADFKNDLLDPGQTDWLDETTIDLTYDEDSEESEAVVRQLFNRLVLAEIGVKNAESLYSY